MFQCILKKVGDYQADLFFCLQVLQKQMDLELELFGDLKDKSGSSSVGKVYMLSLSSQPVDHEDAATSERQKVNKCQLFVYFSKMSAVFLPFKNVSCLFTF